MSYFYKTDSSKVLAGVRAGDEKKEAWNAQRKKLDEAFGAEASSMYSGSRNYVGGIKLSVSHDLDMHWCMPDEYGYRSLRRAPKHAKGTDKEVRVAEKAERQRLKDLWKAHRPDDIDRDEMGSHRRRAHRHLAQWWGVLHLWRYRVSEPGQQGG